jgi:uncharacterized protein YkwD
MVQELHGEGSLVMGQHSTCKLARTADRVRIIGRKFFVRKFFRCNFTIALSSRLHLRMLHWSMVAQLRWLIVVGCACVSMAQHAPAPNPPCGLPLDGYRSQPPTPQAQQLYSHGDPTPEEQLALEYINRARANPPAEGERLAATTDPDVVQSYQYFGIDKNKIRADFQNYPARPPLAFHPQLIQAARNHSRDMQQNDFQGHTGSDGSSLQQRLQRVGYTGTTIGENVFAYARSMWHAHCGFNVDWGADNQQTLGHRRNIMNFDGTFIYNEIGIGVVQDNNPATQVGPYIITQDFARSGQVYILGVVYRDRNGNGFYDIGEGLAGVTITPSRGNYYTVTFSSGGYAIPVTGLTGSITLTAEGNGIIASKTVTLTGVNVKVDFSQHVAPVPLPLSPETSAQLADTAAVKLVWRSIPQAQRYHVQVATDSTFATLVVNDSTLRDTTYVLRSLRNRAQYWWRVRGRHATLGWSEFSAAVWFRIVLPLQVPTLYEPADTIALDGNPIRFRWSSAGDQVDSYWIEVVSDTDSYDLVYDAPAEQDTTYLWTNPDSVLEVGHTYYWHVVVYALTDFVFSPWKRLVVTGTSSVSSSDETTAVCYDHWHDAVIVRRPEAGPVAIAIYDVRGSVVETTSTSARQAVVPVAALPPGVYCVALRAPNGVIERRTIAIVR